MNRNGERGCVLIASMLSMMPEALSSYPRRPDDIISDTSGNGSARRMNIGSMVPQEVSRTGYIMRLITRLFSFPKASMAQAWYIPDQTRELQKLGQHRASFSRFPKGIIGSLFSILLLFNPLFRFSSQQEGA